MKLSVPRPGQSAPVATTDMSTNLNPGIDAYDELRQRLGERPEPTLRHDRPIWLFGAGKFAQDVYATLNSARYNIRGFIETQPKLTELYGLPIRSWEQIEPEPEDQLVIAIHNRTAPLDQLASLARAQGFINITYPWDIHRQFPAQLGWRFWLSGPSTLLEGFERLKALHERLADDESRRCLHRIVSFRLGLDDTYASFRHDLAQYFNPLTLPSQPDRPLHYIDGGAFDGDSLLQLAAHHPIAQAYLFEPDPANYLALCNRLRTSSFPVHCLPLGLMSNYQVLSFAGGQGEGGSFNGTGNIHVACAALDDLLPNIAVDFIKLDVEGAEIPALHGARRLIEKHRPTLAISLYHRPEDLWEIPAALDNISADFHLYIRQHYFNSFDSVLYATPANSLS